MPLVHTFFHGDYGLYNQRIYRNFVAICALLEYWLVLCVALTASRPAQLHIHTRRYYLSTRTSGDLGKLTQSETDSAKLQHVHRHAETSNDNATEVPLNSSQRFSAASSLDQLVLGGYVMDVMDGSNTDCTMWIFTSAPRFTACLLQDAMKYKKTMFYVLSSPLN